MLFRMLLLVLAVPIASPDGSTKRNVKEKAERDEQHVPNHVCTKVRDAGSSAFSLPGTKDALALAHVLAVVTAAGTAMHGLLRSMLLLCLRLDPGDQGAQAPWCPAYPSGTAFSGGTACSADSDEVVS
jgi:hypothetical protein